jgi:hypothetical protein
MNGATALLWQKNIKEPKSKSMMIIGASHHFFLTLKKSQNSLNMPNLPKRILLL